MLDFIADLLSRWVTELTIVTIHKVYVLLLIALDAAFVAFMMERFFKFNRGISWLTGLLVFVWLSEHIIVKKSPWSILLIPSVVGLLLLILFVRALEFLWKESAKSLTRKGA